MFFKKKASETGEIAAATGPVPANVEPVNEKRLEGQDDEGTGTALGPTDTTATKDIVYPSGIRLFLLMASVFISMFLVALDRLIITTAIPEITNEFHSVTDIGWYGAAYLFTNCAFMLLTGKIYTFWSVKLVLLTSILLFEVGSAICGAAPNSVAFIVGRAIAGIGAAGIMSGVIVTIVYAVPLHNRPKYQGLFGAVFGVSSIIGPLVGGAFTSNVTWRWCFYINLPIGGVTALFIFLLLDIPERETTKAAMGEKIKQMDLLGTAMFMPGVISLLLALQWGGSEYEWSNSRIIALLVLAGVLLIAFVLVQIYKPDTATIPPRIIKGQRSIVAGFWATICHGASMMIFNYFLPVWFQAIKGVSALDSGVRLLPMILPLVFASIFTGFLTSKIGYYTPFMIFGSCLLSIGAGLMTTLQIDSGTNAWAGYQVIYGLGLGCMMQAPNLAAQTVLNKIDVPIGTSLMIFGQLLGGAIFTAVGQNVLNNQLLEKMSNIQGFNPALLMSEGATTLITKLPEAIRPIVLFQYNEALRKVFQVGVIVSCFTFLGAVSMEWKSVKKHIQKKDQGDGGAAEEGKAGELEGEAKDGSDKGPETEDEKTVVGGETGKEGEKEKS
ncbi:major facilitator superfamily domain-containing protein [Rhypophila decipiens]|uniref:Major facilitator superfamily domain-containing protein n=1 Tax=Rhypophila decipiens TaxID=261697 RepID=A0AAN6Y250_9PEZI|nr:major facilitator superfamily domain-containing protein [Rhypophila decipiens]